MHEIGISEHISFALIILNELSLLRSLRAYAVTVQMSTKYNPLLHAPELREEDLAGHESIRETIRRG